MRWPWPSARTGPVVLKPPGLRPSAAVHLRFRLEAGVETKLKELVALEQECCPFLTFALETMPGEMVLTIPGDVSAR